MAGSDSATAEITVTLTGEDLQEALGAQDRGAVADYADSLARKGHFSASDLLRLIADKLPKPRPEEPTAAATLVTAHTGDRPHRRLLVRLPDYVAFKMSAPWADGLGYLYQWSELIDPVVEEGDE